MSQFAEVLDELPANANVPAAEQQQQPRQANPTIISKFRNNFLPNTKQSSSRSKFTCISPFFPFPHCRKGRSSATSALSKFIFAQPTLESTTGNQILLTTDEPTTTSKFLPTPTAALPPMRPRAGTFIPDDAHVGKVSLHHSIDFAARF